MRGGAVLCWGGNENGQVTTALTIFLAGLTLGCGCDYADMIFATDW